jgi:hypothetical protein
VTGRIASFDWTADQIGGHLLELSGAMAEEVAAMTGRCEVSPPGTGGEGRQRVRNLPCDRLHRREIYGVHGDRSSAEGEDLREAQ